jgi:superfamily II DNA helicase RecQ
VGAVLGEAGAVADIARLRPKTKDELKGISGVGQSKLQRYGTAVLDVVRKH